jgi:DNA-binding NarL/FixJ family response regulator
MIRVLLCDDVAELRTILREMIADEPGMEVVGEADNGRDCVSLAAELRPDAVLLDLSMPRMDGLEAIPEVVASSPRTAIVVFSGFGAERMRQQALTLGADRYVDKGSPLEEVAEAVRDAVRGRRPDGGGPGHGLPSLRFMRSWWSRLRAGSASGADCLHPAPT